MPTSEEPNKSVYYVASLAQYVLVQANSTDDARAKGEEELGKPARTVRLATPDEIDLQAFHDRMSEGTRKVLLGES
jgi:hypothetical protein